MNSKPTCRLVTLGCKVNQYETELVKEALVRGGYREASEEENADLCVVNTCTVTATGDSKGRQLIRQLARKNPGSRTIVMGCYATREPAALSGLPGVIEVVEDKRELPDVLARVGVNDFPTGISTFQGRRRAYVKVQDGCILNCTYCIIPQVRPGLRSRPPQEIEEEVRRLIHNGHKEIVLCGIHLGHYGVDATRGRSGKAPFRLSHLIERLDCIPGDWRMRLSSIEAAEITPDFVEVVANAEKLCPHFHPSLQSGSRDVLLRMKRRYSLEMFLSKMEILRENLDNPAFSTDVIVGFPGETEADFQETLAVCKAAGFMKIHVFPFSARAGTPAATLPDQISPDVKKEWGQRLAALGASYTRVGGVSQDLPPGWLDKVRHFVDVQLPPALVDLENLLLRNRIFIERCKGVGVITQQDAIDWSITGPIARASGVRRDLRKDEPYLCFEDNWDNQGAAALDFKVPIADGGDVLSRFLVRLEETKQSQHLIRQLIDLMPNGPVNTVADERVTLPNKQEIYFSIEGLISHFEKVMTNRGLTPPLGEAYGAIESPTGELGFHLVSDGSNSAYRARCRPPGFINYQIFPKIIIGHQISDVVAVLGSLEIIAAELDR